MTSYPAQHHNLNRTSKMVVDNYVKIKKDRLRFCANNQAQLRSETYKGLMDYLHNHELENDVHVGKTLILPSTFIGSPRNMMQQYQDSMAIVARHGRLDLFITMTCNPNWKEIQENLFPCQTAADRPDIFPNFILCSYIFLFSYVCSYYGLGLWLPELFNRFETYYKHHPNSSVSVCELINDANKIDVSNISKYNLSCTGINEQVFINTLIINAVCLLGNVTSGYYADRVERRTIPVTTMLIAGMAGVAIYFVTSSLQNLIVSCIFSVAIATANFALSGAVIDIFPTHVGAMAICLSVCFGRIGAILSNLIFGMLLDISCDIPIFLVASMVLLGGFLGFLIPQSRRRI
ncbi:uncharacterized protein LOC122504829 [Leptopilina heterotoma]|uniref:uncharacterized protein LOC122504829 n=1 Tax=Leptopilina heterotoma TaxID=63436 RepID=UPI001CA95C8A|nr:uncharacterized protein LOC122504829 [Leptopilina heterotoma]